MAIHKHLSVAKGQCWGGYCHMHDVFMITQTSESTEWCPRMSRALILILAPAGFRVFLVYHSWIWINPFNQMLWICAFNFNSHIPQIILAEPEPIKKRLGMFFFLLETLWLHWRRIFRCYWHKKQSQQIDRDGRCWLFPKLLFPIPMTPVARDTICDHLQILIPLFIFCFIYQHLQYQVVWWEHCMLSAVWASGRPVDQRFNSKPWRPNFVSNMFHPRSIRWCISMCRLWVYMWYLFPLFSFDFSQSSSPTEHSIGFCGRTSRLNLQCLVKSSQTFFFLPWETKP